MEKLINQFEEIDSPKKWYGWVNEVNALPDNVAGELFKKIGNKKIGTKRNKFSLKK